VDCLTKLYIFCRPLNPDIFLKRVLLTSVVDAFLFITCVTVTMLPDVVFEKEIAMFMHHNNKCVMICLLGTLLPTLVWASTDFNRPPRGERRRPPQEAFDACKGKTEGTSVTIATPHGNFKATCRNFEGSLAAVPEGASPPQQGNDLKP
jgi:hypothetical protein